jgi:hypothetical protein
VTVPPRPPAEIFATLTQWLTRAVVVMIGGNRLPQPLVNLIVDRIRGIRQRFSRIAARIAAGRYVARPQKAPPRRRPGQAPPKDPLPKNFGWLLPLVPDAVCFRSQLEGLLQNPEMAALIAAAPAPMGRALRPLCRMLGLTPPAILARPRTAPADAPPNLTQADPAQAAPAAPPEPPPPPHPAPPPHTAPAPAPPSLTLEYGSGWPRLVWT